MTNLFFRVCELSIRDNSSKDYTKYYMKDFVPKKIILNTHWTVHPVFGPFVSKYRKFHVEDVRKLCRSGHHDSSSLVDNYFSPKCFVYRFWQRCREEKLCGYIYAVLMCVPCRKTILLAKHTTTPPSSLQPMSRYNIT